jgi:hypothetical protein
MEPYKFTNRPLYLQIGPWIGLACPFRRRPPLPPSSLPESGFPVHPSVHSSAPLPTAEEKDMRCAIRRPRSRADRATATASLTTSRREPGYGGSSHRLFQKLDNTQPFEHGAGIILPRYFFSCCNFIRSSRTRTKKKESAGRSHHREDMLFASSLGMLGH